MASTAVVAKRVPDVARAPSRGAPWRAELDALGALLAESRGGWPGETAPGGATPAEALCARVAAIVAEEAGDRLGEALVRRIAERTVRALG